MEWQFLNDPTEAGWYATLVQHGLREGVFPSAAYWDGEKWDRDVVGFGWKKETEQEAAKLAYEYGYDL